MEELDKIIANSNEVDLSDYFNQLNNVEKRTVDADMLERLTTLKKQVYSIKDYEEKLEKIKDSKPNDVDATKNLQDYEKLKKLNTTSVVATIISYILAFAVIVGYVWFCIYDAKNGLDVFYPTGEGFTLTYLFKVVVIGLIGGAIACFILIILGFLIDTLIEKIKLASYDDIHKTELENAKALDNAYLQNFEQEKLDKINELTQNINMAKEYVDNFVEVDADAKTIEEIDRFYNNVTFVMSDGIPFTFAYTAYKNLYVLEKALNLYYYTIFPQMYLYTENTFVTLTGEFVKALEDRKKYFTEKQWKEFNPGNGFTFSNILKAVVIGKADIIVDRIKTINSKKDGKAFYEETIKMEDICAVLCKKYEDNK